MLIDMVELMCIIDVTIFYLYPCSMSLFLSSSLFFFFLPFVIFFSLPFVILIECFI